MGMSFSQSRFLRLTNNKASVQESLTDIAKRRDALAVQTKQQENLFEMETGSPEAHFTFSTLSGDELDAFLNDFNEKMDNANNTFDASIESIETQVNAANKETDAIKQIVRKSVDNGFSTFS